MSSALPLEPLKVRTKVTYGRKNSRASTSSLPPDELSDPSSDSDAPPQKLDIKGKGKAIQVPTSKAKLKQTERKVDRSLPMERNESNGSVERAIGGKVGAMMDRFGSRSGSTSSSPSPAKKKKSLINPLPPPVPVSASSSPISKLSPANLRISPGKTASAIPLKRTASLSQDEILPASPAASTLSSDNSPPRKRVSRAHMNDKKSIPATTTIPAGPSVTSITSVINETNPPFPSEPPQSVSKASINIIQPTPLRLSPAKDLSSAFSIFKQTEPKALKKGTTKKMLSRTVSNSSISANLIASTAIELDLSLPSPELLSPAPSNPSSPARSSQSGSQSASPSKVNSRALSRAGTIGTDSNRVSGQSNAAALPGKKTYGSARSYKKDVTEDSIYAPVPIAKAIWTSSPANITRRMLPLPLPLPVKERETYALLRKRWGVDAEGLADEGEGLEISDLKSITQLRAKGENSRFVDEFNYLVEGLDSGMTLGVRRASAVEVIQKLITPDFVRRLKASGFGERVYVEFRNAEAGTGDRILDSALAFLIAYLVRDQRIAEPFLRVTTAQFENQEEDSTLSSEDENIPDSVCDVLIILNQLLERDWVSEEVGKASKGLSKSDQRSLTSIRSTIDNSKLFADSALPITIRSLVLVAISVIASFEPRPIFQPQALICQSGTLEAVVTVLVNEAIGLEARLKKFEAGFDLLPSDDSITLDVIDTALRIIEACLTTSTALEILTTLRSSLIQAMHTIILSTMILTTSTAQSTAFECLLGILRILIEFTTLDDNWSEAIASQVGMVECLVRLIARKRLNEIGLDGANNGAGGFDILCLALGVLTNVVEEVEEVKETLREILIDPTCNQSRRCARACRCSNRNSGIHRLSDLYLDPLIDSKNEVETSFIHGYSGILLGLLMLEQPLNQEIIIQELRNSPKGLEDLLEAMKEFASLHDHSEKETVMIVEGEEVVEINGEGGEGGSEIAKRIRVMIDQVLII